MRHLSAFALFLFVPVVWGQTSAYQSSDGRTSIFLANAKGNFIFNASDTRFDFGYLHEENGKSWLYGLDLTGKASSDFANLFQKGKLPADAGGAVSLGRHHPFSKELGDQGPNDRIRDDWALVQFTYRRSSFLTVGNFASEPQQRNFDAYRVLAVENALVNARGVALLLGIGAGIERSNNLGDLKQVTISTPVIQSAPGIPPFVVTQQKSGYYGNYQQYLGAPVYSDTVLFPKTSNAILSRLGLDLFTRSDTAPANRSIAGGVGIFLSKRGQPTQVLGGVSLAWRDGTPSIGIVAGFAF